MTLLYAWHYRANWQNKIEVKIFCDTACVYYIWSLIKKQVESEKKKGKYGIEYTFASVSDGPHSHG